MKVYLVWERHPHRVPELIGLYPTLERAEEVREEHTDLAWKNENRYTLYGIEEREIEFRPGVTNWVN